MQAAFADLPLALFTTLSLIGAGAFIMQAILMFTSDLAKEHTKRYDKLMFVPILVVGIGFLCAAAHMANPTNAIYAMTGLGTSPLTNEVVIGMVFLVITFVLWIFAVAGKLKEGGYKAYSLISGILALVFSLFIGFAYLVPTIISWDTVWTVLEPLGYALFAGSLFELFILELAKLGGPVKAERSAKSFSIMLIAGLIVGYGALIIHLVVVNGMATTLTQGSVLVGEALPCAIIAIVLAVLALVFALRALKKEAKMGLLVTALVCMVLAVFCGRLVFYALQLSVAL